MKDEELLMHLLDPQDLKTWQVAVGQMLSRIWGQQMDAKAHAQGLEDDVKDKTTVLEDRVSSLERFRWMTAGALTVMVIGMPAIMTLISIAFG